MWRSRWSRLLVVLLVSLVLVGCGSSVDQGGGGSPLQEPSGARVDDASPQANGAPGSPGGSPKQPSSEPAGAAGAPGNQGNGAGAIGAPIKIPEFQQVGAGNVDKIRGEIEAIIRAGCKPRNDLCIRVIVVPRPGSHPTCFGGTDPATESGGVVLDPKVHNKFIIYSGSDTSAPPCLPEDANPDSSVDQPPTDSGQSTESTEPAPEEAPPPEDSQPSPPSSS